MKRKADALLIACPKCRASAGEPCIVFGTLSGGPMESEPPFTGPHRARQALANELPVAAKASSDACRCTNHMGTQKIAHKSRSAALLWATRRPQVRGMRLEPYQCPTTDRWHIRTARINAGAGAKH